MSTLLRWSSDDLRTLVELGRLGHSWKAIGEVMSREASLAQSRFSAIATEDDRRAREKALLMRGERRGRWNGIGSRLLAAG